MKQGLPQNGVENATPKNRDVFFEYKGWHFEWGSEKDDKNFKERGISFKQAAIFFRDGESVLDCDYKHSKTEERWVVTGLDGAGRLLAVCVSWRKTDTGKTSYRIISAHKIKARKVSKHRMRLRKR